MVNIDKETYTIKIITKDTGDFVLDLDNYLLSDGDEVIFTVNDQIEKEQYLLQKRIVEFTDGVAVINLTTEDTNLAVGEYYYDIQINTQDGRVDTVIGPAKFKVIGGITY